MPAWALCTRPAPVGLGCRVAAGDPALGPGFAGGHAAGQTPRAAASPAQAQPSPLGFPQGPHLHPRRPDSRAACAPHTGTQVVPGRRQGALSPSALGSTVWLQKCLCPSTRPGSVCVQRAPVTLSSQAERHPEPEGDPWLVLTLRSQQQRSAPSRALRGEVPAAQTVLDSSPATQFLEEKCFCKTL